jgi:hypothetical protein
MCFAAAGIGSALGAIVSLAGTVVGAAGQMAAANAQAAAATYKSKQERMLAEDALRRGAAAEEAQRRKQAALASRQKAVLAAGNVDLGSGSPLSIIGDTAMLGELDAQTIKANSQRESTFHTANADLSALEASSAKQAGAIGAFSSVLSGIGGLAEKWYKPAQSGASGGLVPA